MKKILLILITMFSFTYTQEVKKEVYFKIINNHSFLVYKPISKKLEKRIEDLTKDIYFTNIAKKIGEEEKTEKVHIYFTDMEESIIFYTNFTSNFNEFIINRIKIYHYDRIKQKYKILNISKE